MLAPSSAEGRVREEVKREARMSDEAAPLAILAAPEDDTVRHVRRLA